MTDITGNDGTWTFMCASWKSVGGKWKIYKNGEAADEGINLANGKTVQGNSFIHENKFVIVVSSLFLITPRIS